jgi:putative transposase
MRKQIADDLKRIYQSATVAEAEQQLARFEAQWNGDYPSIAQIWRRNWSHVIPFFDYPPEIRRIIYTTNAIVGQYEPEENLQKSRLISQ